MHKVMKLVISRSKQNLKQVLGHALLMNMFDYFSTFQYKS